MAKPQTPLTDFVKQRIGRIGKTVEAAFANTPAMWAYHRLRLQIKDFEAKLDDQHEIATHLVSFGSAIQFHIEKVGYHGDDMIIFYGETPEGERMRLIQNVSQLSVLLVAVKKPTKKAARRIGFKPEVDEEVFKP